MRKFLFLWPCLLSACAVLNSNPAPIIPDKVIVITPGAGGTITAGAALTIGVAYLIYDPLAPNWEIQEKRLDAQRFYLSLVMKRFNTGGDGDALSIIKRRAQDLVLANGMGYYRVEALEQRIDSQTIGARRMAEAVVVLHPKAQAAPPVGYPQIIPTSDLTKDAAIAPLTVKKTAVKIKPKVQSKSQP